MLNVKTLTDTMSRMPLPQLQQYAALHKNDPYVVTLALSIANQKKQMMTGQAGQAGMMPQPKVVDQDIAQMVPAAPQQALPEESGIGQLPAQNMQNMAGGGIVAFDEGGEVPGYAGGVFTGEEDMPEWLKSLPPESGIRRTYRAMKQYDKNNPMPVYPTVPATAPAAAPALPPSATQVMSGLPTAATPASAPVAPVAPTGAANTSPLAALVKKSTAPATPTAAGMATTPETVATEMEALKAKQKTENPFAQQIEDLTAEERKALTEEKTQFEQDIEKAGPAFKDREERLKKRGEKITEQEDRLPYMALMEAGLAVMAGTSPNAMTNIGAGSAVGLKSYTAGIDKLTDARDKLDDAFGKIEEFRRNEDNMNAKEKRAMQKAIDSTYAEAKRLGLAALQKDWELDRTDAAKQFEVLSRNRQTVFEQTEQTKRTASTNAAHLQGIDRQMEMYKGPMHVEQVRKDVAAELSKNINFKTASPEEQAAMVEKAIQTRAQTDPLLRQFLGTTGGGGAPVLRYNPQTGKLE